MRAQVVTCDERHQRAAEREDRGVPHVGLCEQRGFEFAGFDAHAAHLELPVGAAAVGE